MARYPSKVHAIQALGFGDYDFVVRDLDNANNGDVEWVNGTAPCTDEAINAKLAELQSGAPLYHLRVERDKRLAETDWWASSDLTMTQAQTDYRQALRDITNSYTSLDDVVWPTKP